MAAMASTVRTTVGNGSTPMGYKVERTSPAVAELHDADDLLLGYLVIKANLALIGERDLAVLKGVNSMVLAHADVPTWEDICTALTDDDLACASRSTYVKLNAEVFRIGIAPVFGCSG